MPTIQSRPSILAELADFMATNPSSDQMLTFTPSRELKDRAEELLLRQNQGVVSAEDKRELSEFEHFEVFMRLLKARLRARKVKK